MGVHQRLGTHFNVFLLEVQPFLVLVHFFPPFFSPWSTFQRFLVGIFTFFLHFLHFGTPSNALSLKVSLFSSIFFYLVRLPTLSRWNFHFFPPFFSIWSTFQRFLVGSFTFFLHFFLFGPPSNAFSLEFSLFFMFYFFIFFYAANLSAARNLADRLRGLNCTSSWEGSMAFLFKSIHRNFIVSMTSSFGRKRA